MAPNTKAGFPVITVLVAAGSLALFLLPDVAHWLIYDRNRVLAGEAWRLITGHAVHFSKSHALYNVVLFSVAGISLERRNGLRFAWLIGLTALVGSLYFLIFMPEMARYGGLSGVASAAVVYLCLQEMRQGGFVRAVWATILLLFLAKVGYEILIGQTVFATPDATPFEVVPTIHIIGAVVAGFQFGVLEGRWRAHSSPRCDTA
ncbi:MAG: rhombosortase [Alphaproteobacteria bacterium]|nr:rhombosortase [Alphaproteobacteria bacterium]